METGTGKGFASGLRMNLEAALRGVSSKFGR
jgi:hypothetical protein